MDKPIVQATISDTDADKIACHMVNKLVSRLSDEKTVNQILGVWSGQLDKHIGQTVRRGAYILFAALVILIGLRLDAILNWVKS